MPLMNMVSNVSGDGLVEFGEEVQPSIMSYRELEKGKECLRNFFKGTLCLDVFIDIPLGFGLGKGPLKEV